eukprot:SM000007S20787  [mRNA]  locus=s7:98296:99252:- [translate_table: standard]
MTNTWRRSPGAQPPHQQHVRRFGGNVRQRSASSALRLPQGGSRCAPRWWTRREARHNCSHSHCLRLAYRAQAARAGRARPLWRRRRRNCGWLPQALHRVRRGHSGHAAKQARHELLTHPVCLHALCRQCASFASVPSHARPSVAEPTCGWMDFAGGWTGLSVAPPIPELKQRALPLFQAAGPAFSCTADS